MFCSRCGTSLRPAFRSCPVCDTPILTGGIAPSLLDKEGSENSGFENIPYVEFGPIGESVSPLVRADASIQAQPVALAPATEVSRPETRAQPVPSSVALQKRPQPHGGSTTWVIAISTFLILLIITAGGLMYYAIAAHPAGLSAQATAVAQTVLTAQVNATSPQYVYTYATRGKPVINDPLSDDGTSEWYQEAPPQANCVFQNGTYHIFTAHQYTRTLCSAGMSFTNFAFQIQMTIFEGKYGGVAFRMVGRDYQWYNLAVGQDGYYMLNLFNGTSGMKALAFRFDSSIKRGLGQTNLITIVGLGNTFFLYINRQFLTQFSDDTYESGQFGLEATSHEYPTADVAYSNLQIWKL